MTNENPEALRRLIEREIAARRSEGCDVWTIEREYELADKRPGARGLPWLLKLLDALEAARPAADWPYREPEELALILQERPPGPRSLAKGLAEAEMVDRIHGGWTGLAAGLTLGGPLRGLLSERIGDVLHACGVRTLAGYLPDAFLASPEVRGRADLSAWVGTGVKLAPRSEWLDLPVCSLLSAERSGGELAAALVATVWTESLPYRALTGAGQAAYRNLVCEMVPPAAALYRNPARQDAGAATRGCFWGMAWPGRPESAARCACEDASVSHRGCGKYLAMWTAALTASAFACADPRRLLEIAAGEIPAQSRLALAVAEVAGGENAPKRAQGELPDLCRRLPWDHAVPTAARIALALADAGDNAAESMGRAAALGGATDIAAGVVGAVLGVAKGLSGLPAALTRPLHDAARTAVVGHADIVLESLAVRTAKCAVVQFKQQRLPW